jgi:hypothetical protein
MGGRCLCRTRQLHFFTCSFSALLDLSSATFTCALLFDVILKSEVRVAIGERQWARSNDILPTPSLSGTVAWPAHGA